VKWDTFSKILKYVDLVLFDIKHMDPQKHKEYTGVSNELILSNLRKLDDLGIPIEIRMPMIPGLNDSEENLAAVTQFMSTMKNVQRIKLLPYHRLGEGKYERLNMNYTLKDIESPDKARMEELVEFMESHSLNGIPVLSG
jgi:pyruvate formate lyase activating enzyme